MQSISFTILVVLTTAITAVAQVDTSFFKDLPSEEELKRLGNPTREEMRSKIREIKRLQGQMDRSWHAGMEVLNDTAHLSPVDSEEDIPRTLEEKIQSPSNIRFLYIDLKKNPMARLPEGFDNLTDLEFLVLTGLPKGAQFDFDDAFTTIAKLTGLTDLYIVNCGEALRSISPAIGQLSELRRLVMYNNSLATIPIEFRVLERLEVLSLEHNNLREIPTVFQHLSTLKKLGLDDNAIATEDCVALERMLPECTITYSGGH